LSIGGSVGCSTGEVPLFSNDAITSCTACTLGQAAGEKRCHFAPVTLHSGAALCAQGERSRRVYFVKAGLVSLSAANASGAELTLIVRGPGSLLCVEAMRGQSSPYEVRALSRVRLCSLPAEEMKRWIGPLRSPARAVLALLLEESGAQRTEVNFRTGSCLRRVARFALAYAAFLAERPDAIRKQVLARMLAMRPETLSRCLTRLERLGAIDASLGVRVQYPRLLSSIAYSEASA
jgi:CRP/FNR family transcriptional regulator, cyclic AMP receptor protein